MQLRNFTLSLALILAMLPCGIAPARELEKASATTGDLSRQETWKGLEYWLRTSGEGFAAPLENMQAEGFERVYGGGALRGLGTGKAGASCAYVLDRDGAYCPAVQMLATPRAAGLVLSLDGREIARFVADDTEAKSTLYCLQHPLDFRRGQRLTLTTSGPVESCRIEGLFFGTKPIRLPGVKIENIQVWSRRPGEAEICWTTSRPAESGTVEYETDGHLARSAPSAYVGKNHRCILEGLDRQKTYRAKIVCRHGQEEIASESVRFQPVPPTPPPTRPQTIELNVPEPTKYARRDWPTTIGLPFAPTALARASDLYLADSAGREIAAQSFPLSRWPDGSIAWAVLDFLASTQSGARPAAYRLQARSGDAAPTAAHGLADLQPAAHGWTLRSQEQTIALGIEPGKLLMLRRGKTETPIALELTTGDGAVWICGPPDPTSVTLEVNGPVRAVLKFSGPLTASGAAKGWQYLVRLTLYKGQPAIGLDISLYSGQAKPTMNPVRSWLLRLPVGGKNVRAAVGQESLETLHANEEIRLLQDKDDHYTLRTPRGMREASHAAGLACAAGPNRQWIVVMPKFWQTYPAGFTIRPEALEVELLPRLARDTYSDRVSQEVFGRLYAWFQDGNYLLRAGQVVRRSVFIIPEAFPGEQADAQAAWWSEPLLPQATPQYFCGTGVLGRKLYAPTAGVWDDYERMFAHSFATHLANRQQDRTFGWMHFGDWYGERGLNYGNNEYDLAWALAVQWMRTGRRDYFDRGQEMARHCCAIDTLHGDFARNSRELVWEHSYNHVGTLLTPEQVHLPMDDPKIREYLKSYGRGMLRGAFDPQGHVFEEGNWVYAALCGDRFLWDTAERVSDSQAYWLTRDFDFGIERCGGWPLVNAVAAYRQTGNPYYLNAARLMIQRCLERQDPASGGWLHYPPKGETDGVAVHGGKAFAVGILSYAILRYLDVEPQPRPEVRKMLVRAADWLMHDAWVDGCGFRYISNCPKCESAPARGSACVLNAELVAFAYEETHQKPYLDFWQEMVQGMLSKDCGRFGKGFAQGTHQTVFGLDRIRPWLTSLPEKPSK